MPMQDYINHITNDRHSTDDVKTLCGETMYGMEKGLISLSTAGSTSAIIASERICPNCLTVIIDHAARSLRWETQNNRRF